MLTLLIALPLSVYALFLLYVLAMAFKRVLPQMDAFEKALAYPAVAAGIVLDWALNWTLFALYFWDWPRHRWELITGRLKRYREIPEYLGDWRRPKAAEICERLNKFDPGGKHC